VYVLEKCSLSKLVRFFETQYRLLYMC